MEEGSEWKRGARRMESGGARRGLGDGGALVRAACVLSASIRAILLAYLHIPRDIDVFQWRYLDICP